MEFKTNIRYSVSFTLQLILVLLCVVLVIGKGGFGGGSRGGGSRGFGGGGSRYSGGGYSRPYGGASYRQNYGGYSGRRTTSSSGFGFGLGRGLLIGYGFGLMTRPVGYRTKPVYGNTDAYKKPLHCTVANSTLYFKSGSSALDLDIDESQKECSNGEDICYGFLTMISANFTKSIEGSSDKIVPVFEVRVEKGCGKKSEFMTNVQKEENQYATSKNDFCWNTNLMNGKMAKDTNRTKGYRILDQIEFCDFDQPLSCESKTASNSTSGKLVFDVDVKERYFKNNANVNYDANDIPVKLQREDCLCDWRLCNGCDLVVLKWYIISISVLCRFIF